MVGEEVVVQKLGFNSISVDSDSKHVTVSYNFRSPCVDLNTRLTISVSVCYVEGIYFDIWLLFSQSQNLPYIHTYFGDIVYERHI